MKRKDFSELKEKSRQDLSKAVSKKRSDAAKAKIEIVSGREKNLRSLKNIRLEIAKILTLIREKEIIEKLEAKSKKGKIK